MLPNISSKPLRVCDGCYGVLSTAETNPNSVNQKATSGNQQRSLPTQHKTSNIKTFKSLNVKSVLSNKNDRTVISNDNKTDLDEVANETKEIEQKGFVEFNNKHLSLIREESIEEPVPKTPPTTPVANYPKPLSLTPVSIEIDPPKPTVEKMFSVDVVDEDLFQKDLEEMPQAPTEEPEIEIKPRNPQLYQLCQMNSNASFWWDVSEDSNEEFGFNFRSDGIPLQPSATTLSPNHPQLTASESVTSYYFEEKGTLMLDHFQGMNLTVWQKKTAMKRLKYRTEFCTND